MLLHLGKPLAFVSYETRGDILERNEDGREWQRERERGLGGSGPENGQFPPFRYFVLIFSSQLWFVFLSIFSLWFLCQSSVDPALVSPLVSLWSTYRLSIGQEEKNALLCKDMLPDLDGHSQGPAGHSETWCNWPIEEVCTGSDPCILCISQKKKLTKKPTAKQNATEEMFVLQRSWFWEGGLSFFKTCQVFKNIFLLFWDIILWWCVIFHFLWW